MGPGHCTKNYKYIRYRCSYNTILYIGASLVAQMVKNPLQSMRHRFDLWVRKIPWRKV